MIKRIVFYSIFFFLIGLAGGYFLGRWHLGYEMSTAMNQAVNEFSKSMESMFYPTEQKKVEPKPTPKIVETKPVDSQPTVAEDQAESDKSQYIKQSIDIYDLRAEYTNDILDGRIPAVFGKIKNKGTKTLSRVEVTAYFMDNAGNTIGEEDFPAVNLGSWVGDNTPLKPNYIREFGFKAKEIPSEWVEGKATVAITDIEFE